MTTQERAAAFVQAWMKQSTYTTESFINDVLEHDKETRRAALLEAAHKVRDRALLWRSHGGAKVGFPYGHLTIEGEYESMADELARLASEGG
ncbi:MAG: hypothetical protein KF784_20115 [Fimbriimonadaceae bacterium]|nr:hypothetical protein [Fimbriimonadaceae bacterium]